MAARSSRRAPPVVSDGQSTSGIVRIDIGVKAWQQRPPTVEAARPSQCPSCKVASRPPGGALAIHGHGVRERQVRGPAEPQGQSVTDGILGRRYRCQHCGAVIMVVPSEVMPRRLYRASAIALALALFGALRETPSAVRSAINPWPIVGVAATGWVTLRRWVDDVRARKLWCRCIRPCPADWSRRRVAERAATTIAAYAPPSATGMPIAMAAFAGAARAR